MRIFVIILLTLSFAFIIAAQSTTWKINNLRKINKHQTEILGNPKLIKDAIEFDGIDDGIFLDTNPIEGFSTFTIEAIFRPDLGGNKEQRWFHIEQNELESRVLLETRLVGDEWFLDTFMKSGENRLPLLAENFKHKLGKWYHVALVYDGKVMKHYVDGNLELSGEINFKAMTKGKTSLGVRQNKVYWFKGAIKKVRFTNKALTPNKFMK
ncbi:MAG: LamG domain-containing protein [Pyrinomonadaceae bacterium]